MVRMLFFIILHIQTRIFECLVCRKFLFLFFALSFFKSFSCVIEGPAEKDLLYGILQ